MGSIPATLSSGDDGVRIHQVSASKAVLLASKADKARLEQLLYSALEARLREIPECGTEVKSKLLASVDRVAQILSHCTSVGNRSSDAADIAVEPSVEKSDSNTEILEVQAQIKELQERVQQLRQEGPQQIADSMSQFFQNSRGLLDVGPAPTAPEAEQAKALRPSPASLQASLATASSKAPILRARLSETLARLERVVTALDEGKENVGPEAPTEAAGKQALGTNACEQSSGLLFQKHVAENLLGSKVL